jgi:hypothetical protein
MAPTVAFMGETSGEGDRTMEMARCTSHAREGVIFGMWYESVVGISGV